MFDVYLGTQRGVFRLEGTDTKPVGLENRRVSALLAWQDEGQSTVILAGSYGDGLFRSSDGGQTWATVSAGLTAPAFRTIVPDPLNSGAILCGTEPARAFRSVDSGQTWRELEGIRSIEGHEEWYLPYSPRAGALRNFYSPPGSDRLLGAVEVGGLLDSPDGGETWMRHNVGPDTDIHHITGHPDNPDLLYASLGYAALKSEERGPDSPKLGGIGRSRDGGATWEKLHTDYTRATIIPPSRPDLLLAGPAPQVGRQGRIEVSSDDGDTWQPASGGIDTPMQDMVELFVAAPDDTIWAICSGGRVLRASVDEWHWQSALAEGTELVVEAVSFVPRD